MAKDREYVDIKIGRVFLRSYESGWEICRERKAKKTGVIREESVGYYARLPQALAALLDLSLAESGAQTVRELKSALSAFLEELGGLEKMRIDDEEWVLRRSK